MIYSTKANKLCLILSISSINSQRVRGKWVVILLLITCHLFKSIKYLITAFISCSDTCSHTYIHPTKWQKSITLARLLIDIKFNFSITDILHKQNEFWWSFSVSSRLRWLAKEIYRVWCRIYACSNTLVPVWSASLSRNWQFDNLIFAFRAYIFTLLTALSLILLYQSLMHTLYPKDILIIIFIIITLFCPLKFYNFP